MMRRLGIGHPFDSAIRGLHTKPSIDLDIFKIGSLIATFFRCTNSRTSPDRLGRCCHCDHDKADALSYKR